MHDGRLYFHLAIVATKPMIASNDHGAKKKKWPFSWDILCPLAPRLAPITAAMLSSISAVDSLAFVFTEN
jgi:hypothetical protein